MAGFAAQTKTYLIISRKGSYDANDEPARVFTKAQEANEWLKENDPSEFFMRTESFSMLREFEAIAIIKRMLESIRKMTASDEMRIYLSASPTFRHKLATTLPYKGNRNPDNKPFYLEMFLQYLLSVCNAEIRPGLEADDCISIDYYRLASEECVPCIVSIDKDLDQIPGHHYNFAKKAKYFVSSTEALRNYYIQVLTGDSTDNIRGLNQVGPHRAEKILGKETDSVKLAKIVFKEYMKRLGTEEGPKALEEVCKLVYLLKNENEQYEALKQIIPK